MIVNIIYRGCVVSISYWELLVDLVLMATQDFDVILRMDWLATYHAFIDYFSNYQVPLRLELSVQGS